MHQLDTPASIPKFCLIQHYHRYGRRLHRFALEPPIHLCAGRSNFCHPVAYLENGSR